MTDESRAGDSGEMAPDHGQARRTALMAHDVVIKLKEMGLPEDLDAELANLSTDLGDLWGAQKAFSDGLEGMLNSQKDWGTVADYLVDLRATIDHMGWHAKSARRPIDRIARYAYRTASKEASRTVS